MNHPSFSQKYLINVGKQILISILLNLIWSCWSWLLKIVTLFFVKSYTNKFILGSKLEFQPYFNLVNCDLKNYQPFTFSTIYNSDCAFLKSKCNEEGQFKFQNGDFSSDTQCGCDYTKGYIFIRQPINTCFCVPSEEDCSCHKSNCRRVLSGK